MNEKLQKVISTFVGIIILGLIIFLLARYLGGRPWMGVIKPYDESMTTINSKTNFKTLEECREWANKEAEKNDLAEGEWDYDCGRDCKVDLGTPSTNDYQCAELTK